MDISICQRIQDRQRGKLFDHHMTGLRSSCQAANSTLLLPSIKGCVRPSLFVRPHQLRSRLVKFIECVLKGAKLQETATGCRERCGGQGYLSCNRFGQILGFAHAGMTAEGDNRVLMMKVAKEYLSTLHLPATKKRLQAASSQSPIQGAQDSHSLDVFLFSWGWWPSFPPLSLKLTLPIMPLSCPQARRLLPATSTTSSIPFVGVVMHRTCRPAHYSTR